MVASDIGGTRRASFTGRVQLGVQGHSTGITASRSSEVYEWLLAQPPLRGLTLAVRHARDS